MCCSTLRQVYDANDVPNLPEPHGPDGTVADGAAAALKYLNLVPQGFGQTVRAARRRLLFHADLPGQPTASSGEGRQSRIGIREGVAYATRSARSCTSGKSKGGQPRLLLVAPMSGHFATLLRHRDDAVAGPRRLHHRLAQPARLPPTRASSGWRTTPPPHRLPGPARASHARGRDLQPSVSALAAAAVMSEDDHPARPATRP
jgi:hypothetical protein